APAPIHYQWQKIVNGSPQNVGTDSASYTVTRPAVADSGTKYQVVILTSSGSVTSRQATLTVTPVALTFTGSKTYDGSASATAAQLTFGNNIDGANLTKAGSVTLAGAGAGAQNISSFSGLTLGGTAADNYTLSGASGSVTVGKANA